MMLSELIHKIVDEFNNYDDGQILAYEIEGGNCEIKDSFEFDFSLNTINKYTMVLRIYYVDEFKLRHVIKFSMKLVVSATITILFVFAKMKYYKSIIALQFYHVACRGVKDDSYILLYLAYERNDIVAFESILNADLESIYESSYFANNVAIDKLFRYNDGVTIFDITEQNIDDLIKECSDKPEFAALLLNYKNKHFKSKEEDMKL